MSISSKSGKQAREEREKQLILKQKFESRITIAKFGKESLDAGDYASALKRFNDYLTTISEVKGAPDIYALKVQHFNPKKELTEMLMVSHIYFEMARVYDAVPKFSEESKKCLEQFVHFTANQPYQVVNSELVRKHLKKSAFKNHDAFRNAYTQIYVQSKKCYIVTFCYGENHPVTHDFRLFKDWLLDKSFGHCLVRFYYNYSSVAVEKWENKPFPNFVASWLVKPCLLLFSKTLLPLIIKKC